MLAGCTPPYTRLGSPLAMKNRRVAEATVTLTAETAQPIGFLAITGNLRFFAGPRDELSMLQPEAITAASLSTIALTVSGAIAE